MQRRSPSFYRKRRSRQQETRYRVNQQIRSPEVFVIDENGKNLDILNTQEAVGIAKEKGLDLVEVQPKANPPICKILDYGQFQYNQEKHKQKQKAKNKKVETKGLRISLRIGEHDKKTRQSQAEKFLNQGNKVNIDMVLKGRERAYIREAKILMEDFIKDLGEDVVIEQPFTKQGGKLSMLIVKKQN